MVVNTVWFILTCLLLYVHQVAGVHLHIFQVLSSGSQVERPRITKIISHSLINVLWWHKCRQDEPDVWMIHIVIVLDR